MSAVLASPNRQFEAGFAGSDYTDYPSVQLSIQHPSGSAALGYTAERIKVSDAADKQAVRLHIIKDNAEVSDPTCYVHITVVGKI